MSDESAHYGTIEQLVEMAASAPASTNREKVASLPQAQVPDPDSVPISSHREVVQATEMIASISSDIAQLNKLQDVGRGQLQDIVNQVAYIRQAMDYTLFLAPDQANSEADLYPLFIWFRRQFELAVSQAKLPSDNSPATSSSNSAGATNQDTISQSELEDFLHSELSLIGEKLERLGRDLADAKSSVATLPALEPAALERMGEVINEELAALSDQLTSESKAIDSQLASVNKTLFTIDRSLQKQQGLVGAIKQHQEQDGMSPYEDLDIRFEELQQTLETQSSRMRTTENVFFGLVAFMLLILMAMSTYTLAFH